MTLEAPIHWSASTVVYWIKEIGFPEYAQLFYRRKVDGATLLTTNQTELNLLGIELMGPRIRIMKEVSCLERNSD